MSRKPWKFISSEVLAKLFGKSLTKEIWEKPDGTKEEYGIIGQKSWVVVLAVTTDGKIIVVNEYKPGRKDFGDELPAGTAINNADDTWQSIATRALQNEAGYTTKTPFTHLGQFYMATRNSGTTATLVLATNCEQTGKQAPKEAGEIEWRTEPLAEWVGRVQRGEISEWSAALATMLALPRLGYRTLAPPTPDKPVWLPGPGKH